MSMKLANDPWLSPGVENAQITSVELRRFHYAVDKSEAQDNKTGAHQMIRMQPIRDDYLQLTWNRDWYFHVSLYIFVFMFHYIVHTCLSINTWRKNGNRIQSVAVALPPCKPSHQKQQANSMYICICICVYMCTCTCMRTCVYVCSTCVCVCVCVRVFVCMCVCVFTCV